MPPDQGEVVGFLSDPASWRALVEDPGPVERIETHGAMIFMSGDRVLKMKRAVGFDWMDFSSVGKRAEACAGEVALNRRAAPDLYLGVRWVTRRTDGGLAFDGPGEKLEPVIEMRRFSQEALFDRMAEAGRLDIPLVERLADAVAAFHAGAEVRRERGGEATYRDVIRIAYKQFGSFGGFLDPALIDAMRERQSAELARVAPLIEARREAGFVRHCHGDLHLRNIVLLDDRPVLFDGIEFNADFVETDVLYDLAFLVMDLLHRDLRPHANVVLSRYLAHTGDMQGLRLLPLFLSCRAAIRGHVAALASGKLDDPSAAERQRSDAAAYLDLALAALATPQARLFAVGGLSGSGKSTVARALAPGLDVAPGAVVLRSDEIRKCLFGLAPTDRLGPEGYTAEVGARVYETLRRRAAEALAAGRSVVVDAVHAREDERTALEAVAQAAGVPFEGVWLEAPAAEMAGRIERRRGDASEADRGVLEAQLGYDLGRIGWRRVQSGRDIAAILAELGPLLGLKAG